MKNIPEYRIKIKRQHLPDSPYLYTEYISDDFPVRSTRTIINLVSNSNYDYLNYWSDYGNYELLDVKFAITPVIFIQIYEK